MTHDWKVVGGDALEWMTGLPAGIAGAVITDPPYGTTALEWDDAAALPAWIDAMLRLVAPGRAIVMTACGQFTAAVILARPKLYRYKWVWDRCGAPTGHLDAAKRPLRRHEDVLVLGGGMPAYWPKLTPGTAYSGRGGGHSDLYHGGDKQHSVFNEGWRHPVDVLQIPADDRRTRLHPTQKPVELMRILVECYTLPGELVIDPFMGSGSTGVAARQVGRRFLGCERDPGYLEGARRRIAEADTTLFSAPPEPKDRGQGRLYE